MSISKVEACAHGHLFHPFCPESTLIEKVKAIVFHIFTFFIPLTIFWTINKLSGSEIKPVSSTSTQPFKLVKQEEVIINRARIQDAPKPITASSLQKIPGYNQVQVGELLDLFKSLKPSIAPHIPQLKNAFTELDLSSSHDKQVRDMMYAYIKAIILELRKNTIPNEKKLAILEDFVRYRDKSVWCLGGRFELVQNTYKDLYNQNDSVEEALLRHIQHIKEKLFSSYYSLDTQTMHTLNYIRKLMGTELGLDNRPENINDPNISVNDARSPDNSLLKHVSADQFRKTFYTIFTPKNLIDNLKPAMNQWMKSDAKNYNLIGDFIQNDLKKQVENGTISEEKSDSLCELYLDPENEYLLTDEGTKFLLLHFKFLNLR